MINIFDQGLEADKVKKFIRRLMAVSLLVGIGIIAGWVGNIFTKIFLLPMMIILKSMAVIMN